MLIKRYLMAGLGVLVALLLAAYWSQGVALKQARADNLVLSGNIEQLESGLQIAEGNLAKQKAQSELELRLLVDRHRTEMESLIQEQGDLALLDEIAGNAEDGSDARDWLVNPIGVDLVQLFNGNPDPGSGENGLQVRAGGVSAEAVGAQTSIERYRTGGHKGRTQTLDKHSAVQSEYRLGDALASRNNEAEQLGELIGNGKKSEQALSVLSDQLDWSVDYSGHQDALFSRGDRVRREPVRQQREPWALRGVENRRAFTSSYLL